MEKNERFNSIVKQLESVKAFASLFEAKNQYQGALQVKSSSYEQLAALFAIEAVISAAAEASLVM